MSGMKVLLPFPKQVITTGILLCEKVVILLLQRRKKIKILIFFQKYNDEIYLMTPRFLPGVPSALNKVVNIDDVPTLQPVPSWEMQEPGKNFTISTYI